MDLRGHGLSGRPENAYQFSDFSKDIDAVLKHARVKNYTLIGHSFGAAVILAHHTINPSAQSYILISSTDKAPARLTYLSNNPQRVIGAFHQRLSGYLPNKKKNHANFDNFKGTNDWDYKRLYSDIRHTTLHSWLSTYRCLGTFDARKVLKTITQPTLLIHGMQDTIYSPAVAKRVAKKLKHSQLRLIPGNHILVINNPQEVTATILDFLGDQ